jgi:hypothetical protein
MTGRSRAFPLIENGIQEVRPEALQSRQEPAQV